MIAAWLVPAWLIGTATDHLFGLPHDALGRVVHAGRSQIFRGRAQVMDTALHLFVGPGMFLPPLPLAALKELDDLASLAF